MDHVSIGYAYNSSIYWFLVHKSSIEYIHPNTIMIEKNDAFFVMQTKVMRKTTTHKTQKI